MPIIDLNNIEIYYDTFGEMHHPHLTFDELVDLRVKGWHIMSGFKAHFDTDQHRIMHKQYLQRARHPESHLNHLNICTSAESLISRLPSQVKHSTLVIHGTEDPIFPIDHGRKL
jgi:pimeloyl-ACP methyl ester carboxylesterase